MGNKELFEKLAALETEQINPETAGIDNASISECLYMINAQDMTVAERVMLAIPEITKAVEIITSSFKNGGRLFYFGAGTSGRLGIVDASECPPTFGTEPEMVQGIIAGGKEAVFKAQEGAEDNPDKGKQDFNLNGINSKDVVCGIAASGRTPYVLGALAEARSVGCKTIFITTVSEETAKANGAEADVMICVPVGAEAITGSTRMKSGTAQKLILNMLTTASMVQLGKTYGNIMIDLKPTNIKLVERAKRIVMNISGADYHTAEEILKDSHWNVKIAIIRLIKNINYEQAQELIEKHNGFLRRALEE